MSENLEPRFPQNLPEGWRNRLSSEVEQSYFKSLSVFLNSEYQQKRRIYPDRKNILRAIQEVDYENVRVLILGQDPYHGPNQAIGLSFAVPNELRPKPPSLVNIFKEIQGDLGMELDPNQSDLSGWTEQGVLLLNSVLTVRASQAFSHRGKGWEEFTDRVIKELNQRDTPIVFVLWGAAAQKKQELITGTQHSILKSPHPSPLSANRGFFGCKHFSKINEILKRNGDEPIDWARVSVAGRN